LRERHDVDGEVIAAVAFRVDATRPRSDVLGSVLHAFKSSDFLRHARTWRDIILEEGVPPALRPVTVDLALLTSELVPGMNSTVAAAVPRLRTLADEPTTLWNRFVANIGVDRIVTGLANQNKAGAAASLLAACRNGHTGLVAALEAKVWPGEPLEDALSSCSVDDFAVVTKIAQKVSVDFARKVVALVGGEEAVFAKVRDKFPTVGSSWPLDVPPRSRIDHTARHRSLRTGSAEARAAGQRADCASADSTSDTRPSRHLQLSLGAF
jgi:hypothetical protein